MFGDRDWASDRIDEQHIRYSSWLREIEMKAKKVVVIDIGSGTAIPTSRLQAESVAARTKGTLIRINVRESQIEDYGIKNSISLPLSSLEALIQIDKLRPLL